MTATTRLSLVTTIALSASLACSQAAGPGANTATPSASPGAPGSAPAAAGGGGTVPKALADTGGIPAKYLDLSKWKLTLPFGEPHHPTEIKQPELETFRKAENFYLSEHGVVFRAHVGGVTTPNSSYPRTELREMTGNGRDRAAWSTTSGRHTMTVTAAVTQLPVAKPHIVAAQVHDAKDDVLMIRLEREHLFVEGGGNNLGTLDDDYQIGRKFSTIIDASQGRVRVYFNGESTPRVDLERAVDGCYFKAGAYVQSNPTKGDEENAYGEVVISELSVIHGG